MKKYFREKMAGLNTKMEAAGARMKSKAEDRLRFKARARLINRWGRKHPKTVVIVFFSTMFVCFGIVLGYNARYKSQKGSPMTSDLAIFKNTFESSARVRAMEVSTRAAYEDVLDKAISCGQELDSLLNIKDKSKADSLRMLVLSEQFQIYKKALSNEED